MADGSDGISVSVELPTLLLEKLDKIASVTAESRSALLLRAVELYLGEEGQEILDVQEGIDELDRGEGVPFEEAMLKFEQTIARMGKAKPAAE